MDPDNQKWAQPAGAGGAGAGGGGQVQPSSNLLDPNQGLGQMMTQQEARASMTSVDHTGKKRREKVRLSSRDLESVMSE